MFFIRQGATHKVVIGPVVAVANGYVPVTSLTLSGADEAEAILHDNGTVVDISGYTFAAITTADGYYHLTLQSGISGTVGHMTVVINDDSLCLPVKAEFTVVEEAVYDAFYAASAPGLVGTAQTGDTYALANGASGFVAMKADTAATLADTNELQTDWANGGRLDLILDARASQTSVDDLPTNSELTTALAAADDAVLAAIAALNNLGSAGAQAAAEAALAAYGASTFDPSADAVEGAVTYQQSMRLLNSAAGGKASGLETTNAKYRDLADSKDRIDATVDVDGNRTAVTLDLT